MIDRRNQINEQQATEKTNYMREIKIISKRNEDLVRDFYQLKKEIVSTNKEEVKGIDKSIKTVNFKEIVSITNEEV